MMLARNKGRDNRVGARMSDSGKASRITFQKQLFASTREKQAAELTIVN
jgi:hypothetical protein